MDRPEIRETLASSEKKYAYFKNLDEYQKYAKDLVGFQRYLATLVFNESFYNKKFDIHDTFGYVKPIQDNSDEFLFDEVLSFSIDNNVFNLLGLSVLDLMNLDLHSYFIIREKVRSISKEKKHKNKLEQEFLESLMNSPNTKRNP